MPRLPVDVLISWKDYISADEISGITSLAVLTRSLTQRCEGGDNGVTDQLEGNGPATTVTRGPVSQYLPRHPESSPAQATNKQPDKLTDGEEPSPSAIDARTLIGDVFKASPQQLAEWQQTEPTLSKIRELDSGGEQAKGRAKFLYQGGLLYRKWSPDGSSDHVNACKQLVLPKQCHFQQIAHDTLAAGHLGINKTRRRILHRFYWPGVFKDVADHCRWCEVCQRSPDRRD